MTSLFERMGGTYTLGTDGIYYPDVVSTDEEPYYALLLTQKEISSRLVLGTSPMKKRIYNVDNFQLKQSNDPLWRMHIGIFLKKQRPYLILKMRPRC